MQAEYYPSVYGLEWRRERGAWALFYKGQDTGPAVGATVENFREEPARLDGGRPPHKAGSTGKVYVTLNLSASIA